MKSLRISVNVVLATARLANNHHNAPNPAQNNGHLFSWYKTTYMGHPNNDNANVSSCISVPETLFHIPTPCAGLEEPSVPPCENIHHADICQKICPMYGMGTHPSSYERRIHSPKEDNEHGDVTSRRNYVDHRSRAKNMAVFRPHFHNAFNNNNRHPTDTDPTIVEHVPQQRVMWELNYPIPWE
jgi:hypothetical protein